MRKPWFAVLLIGASVVALGQARTTVSAEWVKQLVYVPCSVGNSGALHCLLDTGSTITQISRELAVKLKLKPHHDETVARVDLTDKMLDQFKVSLGGVEWTAHPTSIAVDELAALDHESGDRRKTDVVIGTSLLQHFQVTIDPEAKQVLLARLGTMGPEGAEKMQLIVVNDIALVDLALKSRDGHPINAFFTVDTGSRPPLLLGKTFWDGHAPLAVSEVHGVNNTLMRIDAIGLGKFEMRDVTAGVPLDASGILASKLLGGVLGAPVLNRFVVTYDFSQKAMWLKPTADFAKAFDLQQR